MPYLIKQLKKAEACTTRKQAQKVLKKVKKLDGETYIKPDEKN
tara:strand:+ start:91 stop:219 length:129 start_codon:yes stop_codon:yes gene_type:complete